MAALLVASGPKSAAAQSATPGVVKADPAAVMRTARVVHVSSGTSFFEAARLRDELRRQSDFAAWRMAIAGDREGRELADIEVEIDRPLFTSTFTYRLTDRRTSVVLAAGEVKGWDGGDAAPKLAKRIVEEIRRARRQAPGKRGASKKAKRDTKDAKAAQAKN
ncbi:MAG: hypothetical protein LC800_20305 [Acidobacteria bacterium]|nr:hypothetical protein [Acidobacteriota bacterium]